jgi:hypothetical protein
MDYTNHLDNIKHLLSVNEEYYTIEECDGLIEFANKTRFNDRQKFSPNFGIRGDVGDYSSVGITAQNYPEIWNKYFKNKLKNGIPPMEVQINKYEKGTHIPPHADQGVSLYTIVVPLQDEPNNRVVFGDPTAFYDGVSVADSDAAGRTVSFPDKKGWGYQFDGIKPIHWVPPTAAFRYTLIMLYGLGGM